MQGEMVVAVASPSPAAPSAGGRSHPTYKEMILQALTELRDPGGSSRGAIASYIADHFSGLHTRHDSLLTVHLRKLWSHGQLRLVSGNYFVSAVTPGQKRGRGRPRKNADLGPSASVPAIQGPKRGRGRPRKNAALHPVASSPSPLRGPGAPPPPSGVKRGRGRPRKALVPVRCSFSHLLGGIAPPPPSGVKRGRGRPRKALDPVRSSFSQLLGGIAPPPPSGVKRGRGRPRKNASLALEPLLGVEQGPSGGQPPQPQRNTTPPSLPPASVPHSGERKPVRPLRVAVDIGALRGSSTNMSPCSNSVVGAKRGRGRPPKVVVAGNKMQPGSVQFQNEVEARDFQSLGTPLTEKRMTEDQQDALIVQAVAVQNEVETRDLQSLGTSLTEKRGRGRPRKRPLETKTAEVGVAASAVKRGRGRPRKERTLENVDLKIAQMIEGQHEALSTQAADQTQCMQNEVEARILQSFGTPLTEKKMTEDQLEALTAQAADQAGAVQNEVEARNFQSLGTSLTEKRGRGRPRKRPLETATAEAGAAASAVKRGRGRPRKEMRTLENGDLKVAQMTEGRHDALSTQATNQTGCMQNEVEARILQSFGTPLTEKMTEGQLEALTAQAADQDGTVQNEVEARDFQSLGTSLTEKRGRGRPRKRLLETETAEAGVAASTVKRGRGRPRKEKTLETDLKVAQMTEGGNEALHAQAVDQTGPMQNEVEARILQSFGTPLTEKRGRGRPRKRPLETETAETKVAALVKKRGRGRPRKARPFETGSVVTAVEVSRDLTEDAPEKDRDLVSGKKAEAQGVLLIEGIDDGPADAEEAAIAPMDAGCATPRVDPMDVGTKSH